MIAYFFIPQVSNHYILCFQVETVCQSCCTFTKNYALCFSNIENMIYSFLCGIGCSFAKVSICYHISSLRICTNVLCLYEICTNLSNCLELEACASVADRPASIYYAKAVDRHHVAVQGRGRSIRWTARMAPRLA